MKKRFETGNYVIVVSFFCIGLRKQSGIDELFDPITIIHKKHDWLNNYLSQTYYGYLIGYTDPATTDDEVEEVIQKLIEANVC